MLLRWVILYSREPLRVPLEGKGIDVEVVAEGKVGSKGRRWVVRVNRGWGSCTTISRRFSF